VPPKGTNI